jgi:hypothetical protein
MKPYLKGDWCGASGSCPIAETYLILDSESNSQCPADRSKLQNSSSIESA